MLLETDRPLVRSVRRCAVVSVLALVFLFSSVAMQADERALPKPNYDLAARWMATKVGKLVFDTGVTAHWADTSDRFWYPFETAQGRKFYLVDPLKRGKAPLWDNARIAALLPPMSVFTQPGWNTTAATPLARHSGSISRNRSLSAHFDAP